MPAIGNAGHPTVDNLHENVVGHGTGIPAFLAACLALARSSSDMCLFAGTYGARATLRGAGFGGARFTVGLTGSFRSASIESAMRCAACTRASRRVALTPTPVARRTIATRRVHPCRRA